MVGFPSRLMLGKLFQLRSCSCIFDKQWKKESFKSCFLKSFILDVLAFQILTAIKFSIPAGILGTSLPVS